jgi:hypothetical protein
MLAGAIHYPEITAEYAFIEDFLNCLIGEEVFQ